MVQKELIAEIKKALRHGEQSSGSFGTYFRIGEDKGIKILDCGWYSTNKRSFRFSYSYNKTKQEADLLKAASEKTDLVPKFLGLITFKHKGTWRAGILQEHIEGKSLDQYKYPKNAKTAMTATIEKLKAFGVFYRDRNECNFIKQGRKVRVIDFTPEWVKVEGVKLKKA